MADLQHEYWNGDAARRWIAAGEELDRMIEGVTGAAMALAAPRAGQRVLDVGCGCGTTTLRLHELVAPDGVVEGVDISAPMLEVARARGARLGVRFTEADAATYRTSPAPDLVFSRFGVMFFSDPRAAFAGMRGGMATNGRLVFVCWRSFDENPWASVPLAVARDLLPAAPPPDPHAPGPFAFADRERLHGLLTGAGFARVSITPHDDVAIVGESVEQAADQALTIGPLARAAGGLPESVRQDIRARIAPAFERFATPRGVAPPAAVWLVEAR